jgi:putative ABC transport system permease protein
MLWKDLSYAVRVLRNNPVFVITAVVTLALGVGATTAIFSVTHTVLLRPLPYKDPDRLVLACGDMRKRDVKDFPFSNAEFFDLRDQAKSSFVEFGAVRTGRNILPREDGTPEQIRFAQVTTDFFRMMGGRIQFGRDFVESDGQPPPPAPQVPAPNAQLQQPPTAMAILSYEYFERRYGGNTAILGHRMLNGGTGGPQVVGVLAPRFELLFPPEANMEQTPDVWTAARLNYDAANRNNVSLRVIGRLRNGVTLEQAQAEADAFSAGQQQLYTIQKTADFHVRLEPMQQHLVSAVRPAILALMGAVIFLWLIACANVANLMLVRASLRERELVVRTALGAHRWDLVRQMLTEALLLAGIGAFLGLGLAWFGIRQLRVVAPANLPRLDSIAIDGTVLAFAAIAGLLAAALFGIVPALRAARPDVMQVLRASGRTSSLGGSRVLRNSLVIVEVALSFVLLIGSGLMFRSFQMLRRIDPGFDSRELMTFQLLGPAGTNPQERATFMRKIHDRLHALPGVQNATASSFVCARPSRNGLRRSAASLTSARPHLPSRGVSRSISPTAF